MDFGDPHARSRPHEWIRRSRNGGFIQPKIVHCLAAGDRRRYGVDLKIRLNRDELVFMKCHGSEFGLFVPPGGEGLSVESSSRPARALPVRTHRLDNGLTVVLLENHAAPVAAIQVWVGVGAADEKPEEGGIAHVHEHMLFKGTKRRAVGEIASEIEGAGGEINAWTSLDQTVYHVVLASRFFDTGIDVLADAILESAFDPEELERELEVILEEINRAEDQPQSRVSRALFNTAFDVHPYRHPVIGSADVVRKLTREQILEFYQSHYRPDRLCVVAVGDFEEAEALEKIRRAFGSGSGKAIPLQKRPDEPEQKGARARVLSDEIEESHLAIGFKGPSIRAEDLVAVDVMAVLLGQGDSSRLTCEVRRERQLVNEIYAYAYTPRDTGLFVIGATLQHEKLHDAVTAIGREVLRIREAGVSAAELEKARTILAAEAVYQRETAEGLARRIGYWQGALGDPGYEESYQQKLQMVTIDQVRQAAERYLVPDKATLVTMVPRPVENEFDEKDLAARLHKVLSPRAYKKVSASDDGGPTLFTLPSGARVVIHRDATNPIVAVRAVWLGGLRAEREDTAGYCTMLSDMLIRGTDRLTASELARLIDGQASHLDGFSGRNSIGLRATFLAPHFGEGMSLMGDCIQNPSFDYRELERAKTITLDDLRARADNPAGLCFELFQKSLWQNHPYRRNALGTTSSIREMTPEGLREFYHRLATQEGAVLSVVGDVEPGQALALAEEAISGLPARFEGESWSPTPEEAPVGKRVARMNRDKAQAHLIHGFRGLALGDRDRYSLEVLASALSGQGGRLFLELRDRQSLCYSVSSFAVEGIEPGSFGVYMATSPDKLDRALTGIADLLDALVQDGLRQEELERAQRYLIGTHGIGLQRLGARASTMALNELYGTGFNNHREYASRIDAVTLDDVRRVAQRILNPGHEVITVVGPDNAGGPKANVIVTDLDFGVP